MFVLSNTKQIKQMELIDAQKLCFELMLKHGLFDWSFKWTKSKRVLGSCNFKTKTIKLSAIITKVQSVEDVRDTILHEIAHALVGPNHNHDSVWYLKAREIGCNGERCYRGKIDVPKKYVKYIAHCPKCGREFRAYRKRKRDAWCKCTNRTFKEEEKLVWVENPEYQTH